jgi:GntR family transcriptional regulator, transcriptional repressor for pyruvate dehydrogenase complex
MVGLGESVWRQKLDETLERLMRVLISVNDAGQMRMPTERDLAKDLGVNRSTVRESLSALEILGLVRRTQGSGTYLGMPHPTFVRLYFEMAVELGHVKVAELQQAREMIERVVTRQATLSATEEDVSILEECVDRMLHSDSFEEGDRADYNFHLQLVRATYNPVMLLIFDGLSAVLWELLRQRRYKIRHVQRSFELTNRDHVPILHAIKARDPDRAVAAMEEHFRIWNEEYRKVEEGADPAGLGSITQHTANGGDAEEEE